MRPRQRRTPRFALLLAAGAAAGCTGSHPAASSGDRAPTDPLAAVAFLQGTWRTSSGNGVWTEEQWSAPAGGCMLGASRTIGVGDDATESLRFFEFLRIQASEGEVVYLAAPMGRHPPTPFRLVHADRGVAVFSNPDHDFPTRISYELDSSGKLHATAGGADDVSQPPQKWVFTRTHPR